MFGTVLEFEEDLYDALTDVMFKYRDYPVSEIDHKEEVKSLMNCLIDQFYEFKE